MEKRKTGDIRKYISRGARAIEIPGLSIDAKLKVDCVIFDNVEIEGKSAVQYSFGISWGETGWSCRVKVFSDRFNGDEDKIEMGKEMMGYVKQKLADRMLSAMRLLIDEALTLSTKQFALIDRTDARDQQLAILHKEKTKAFEVIRGRRKGQKDRKETPRKKKKTLTQAEVNGRIESILDAIWEIASSLEIEMDEIGVEHIRKKQVASKINTTPTTITDWVQRGGYEWDDLVRKGMQRKSKIKK